jgi:hypothetical protein
VLGVDDAAALFGMSRPQFLKEVAAGTLPPPIGGLLFKRKLWSVRSLEAAANREPHPHDTLMSEIRRATRAS